MKRKALLLVDVQSDFFPGGDLPAPCADTIIEPVNRLIEMTRRNSLPVFATRDWHPENHCSFKEQGGPWPRHCVQGSEGAAFHPRIKMPPDVTVISTADTPDEEAYSGFKGTDLFRLLKDRDVSTLIVGGLVTEVCVKETVLDALERGFDVIVIEEAISAIDASPGDGENAIKEMKHNGASIISIEELKL